MAARKKKVTVGQVGEPPPINRPTRASKYTAILAKCVEQPGEWVCVEIIEVDGKAGVHERNAARSKLKAVRHRLLNDDQGRILPGGKSSEWTATIRTATDNKTVGLWAKWTPPASRAKKKVAQ